MEKTEKQRMINGEFYNAWSTDLTLERVSARSLVQKYNATTDEQNSLRQDLLQQLLGSTDLEDPPFIDPPFRVDYGYNISMGRGVYLNFDCCFLDVCPIKIGDNVMFGPHVQLYTPTHPLDPIARNGLKGREYGKPITIGHDVWIGGSVIIMGGVTVGDGSTIGAGSVVTKNVEPWTVVAGNPARVIKWLEKHPDTREDVRHRIS